MDFSCLFFESLIPVPKFYDDDEKWSGGEGKAKQYLKLLTIPISLTG